MFDFKESLRTIASEYGSSPVEHPACHTLSFRDSPAVADAAIISGRIVSSTNSK
jgi:hypothetical protein